MNPKEYQDRIWKEKLATEKFTRENTIKDIERKYILIEKKSKIGKEIIKLLNNSNKKQQSGFNKTKSRGTLNR